MASDAEGRRRGLLGELVGPSGSGKTSLLRALGHRNPDVAPGPVPSRLEQLPHQLRNAAVWLPALLRHPGAIGDLDRRPLRAMSYLRAWLEPAARLRSTIGVRVIMDQGPVFRLAYLHQFGPPTLTASRRFQSWWRECCQLWGAALDVVICLDAADATLIERVRRRPVPHPIRQVSEMEARDYLARYRRGFDAVLEHFQEGRGPTVLRFHSGSDPLDAIVERVHEALEERARAA